MNTPENVTTQDVLYYGCWSSVGHGLYDVKGDTPRRFYRSKELPFNIIDAGFLLGTPDTEHEQGWVQVSRIGARWTILSFWDRSVDSRPASNSNFILPGMFSYEDAMDWAKQAFPHVFARLKFPLVRAHYDGFKYGDASHGSTT